LCEKPGRKARKSIGFGVNLKADGRPKNFGTQQRVVKQQQQEGGLLGVQ